MTKYQYRQRVLEEALLGALKFSPAIALTGPRQSGKSTMLQHMLGSEYRYITFDLEANVSEFYDDPKAFMLKYDNKVIFDEAQRVPELFSYVKIAVDEDRQTTGKYILTGSQQFLLLEKITESLAGRILYFTLLPFQFSELPQEVRAMSVYAGSYPELVDRKYEASELWYGGYLESYVQKDVRSISNIGNLTDFIRFIRLLSARVSQTLDYSSYAVELGVSLPTIKRWVSILEASYIIFQLPPYFSNLGKRITKRSKLYFYDTGLVAYLTHVRNKEDYENGPMKGAIFENYIISEIKKIQAHKPIHDQLYYYRTTNGVEIDLIIDRGAKKDLVEIKSSATPTNKMTRAMKTIYQPNDRMRVVYQGETNSLFGAEFVNYQDFLEDDL